MKEALTYGSLKGIVNQVGAMPETIIKHIVKQTIRILCIYHNKLQRPFLDLNLQTIKIDFKGNVKVKFYFFLKIINNFSLS